MDKNKNDEVYKNPQMFTNIFKYGPAFENNKIGGRRNVLFRNPELDELKAEFEAMMGKKDGDDEEKDETVAPEVAPELTPEVEMEGKDAKEAMHKDKKKMSEYKIQKSADNADHADKKNSPVADKKAPAAATAKNIAQGGEESES